MSNAFCGYDKEGKAQFRTCHLLCTLLNSPHEDSFSYHDEKDLSNDDTKLLEFLEFLNNG